MEIRPATAADLDGVAAVYDAIHDEEEAGRAVIGWVGGRVRAHTCACGLSLLGLLLLFCKPLWVQKPELGASQRPRRDPQLNPGILSDSKA